VRPIAALGLILAVTSSAAAHETWLLPDQFRVAAGKSVQLELTSGMEFPSPESAVKPERVRRARVRLAGKTFDLPKPASGAKALYYDATLPSAGTAVVSIELEPRSIELNEKQVEHYFEEIGASESVRKAWADAPKPRRFREVYTKHAKTIIQVGDAADDATWSAPAGLKLELVPVSHPLRLKAGDELKLKVLRDGKPFAGFRVGVQDEKGKRGEFATSDAGGLVTVKPVVPGRCLIFGTDLRSPAQPGETWTSDFTTLTLLVSGK